jgi:hypothetical protein
MMLYIEYYSMPYSLSAELTQGTRKVFQEKVWNCNSCFLQLFCVSINKQTLVWVIKYSNHIYF